MKVVVTSSQDLRSTGDQQLVKMECTVAAHRLPTPHLLLISRQDALPGPPSSTAATLLVATSSHQSPSTDTVDGASRLQRTTAPVTTEVLHTDERKRKRENVGAAASTLTVLRTPMPTPRLAHRRRRCSAPTFNSAAVAVTFLLSQTPRHLLAH